MWAISVMIQHRYEGGAEDIPRTPVYHAPAKLRAVPRSGVTARFHHRSRSAVVMNIRLIAPAVLAVTLTCASLSAATLTWNGSADSLWSNAANWTPAQTPA